MSQHASDVEGEQPVQAKRDHYDDGGPSHVVWQEQPNRVGETQAFIRSDVMVDLEQNL